MAEGAGALVLESYDHAKARGAKILASSRAAARWRIASTSTRSSPDGAPVIGCIRNALEDAGVSPADVQYVNAHGTSTPENDKMEYVGLAAVFRRASAEDRGLVEQVDDRPHAIGGRYHRGGVHADDHRSRRHPPTINHGEADPAIQMDVVPNVARKAKVDRAISNSFGFGARTSASCSPGSRPDGSHPGDRRRQGMGAAIVRASSPAAMT